MRKFWTTTLVIIVLACIGFLIWWFLAGGDDNSTATVSTNNSSSKQSSQQATKNAISSNWVKFFAGTTSAQDKVNLLQNGQEFSQTIDAQASSPTAKATSVKVSNVDLSGNTATVTYTIYINGQATLTNQKGQAVKVGNGWKVSDSAFCSLLSLSGTTPPNCPGGSTQTNTQTQTQSTPSTKSTQPATQ